MNSILLIFLLAFTGVFADVKTLQLEFIDIEMDPYTRLPSQIRLYCLIEEDSMAFPIQLSYLELSLMIGSSRYVCSQMELSDARSL